jgi:hypothetical protein
VQLVAGAPLRACTAIALRDSHARRRRSTAPPQHSAAQKEGAQQTADSKQQMQAVCRLLAQSLGQHLDLPDCANTQPVKGSVTAGLGYTVRSGALLGGAAAADC